MPYWWLSKNWHWLVLLACLHHTPQLVKGTPYLPFHSPTIEPANIPETMRTVSPDGMTVIETRRLGPPIRTFHSDPNVEEQYIVHSVSSIAHHRVPSGFQPWPNTMHPVHSYRQNTMINPGFYPNHLPAPGLPRFHHPDSRSLQTLPHRAILSELPKYAPPPFVPRQPPRQSNKAARNRPVNDVATNPPVDLIPTKGEAPARKTPAHREPASVLDEDVNNASEKVRGDVASTQAPIPPPIRETSHEKSETKKIDTGPALVNQVSKEVRKAAEKTETQRVSAVTLDKSQGGSPGVSSNVPSQAVLEHDRPAVVQTSQSEGLNTPVDSLNGRVRLLIRPPRPEIDRKGRPDNKSGVTSGSIGSGREGHRSSIVPTPLEKKSRKVDTADMPPHSMTAGSENQASDTKAGLGDQMLLENQNRPISGIQPGAVTPSPVNTESSQLDGQKEKAQYLSKPKPTFKEILESKIKETAPQRKIESRIARKNVPTQSQKYNEQQNKDGITDGLSMSNGMRVQNPVNEESVKTENTASVTPQTEKIRAGNQDISEKATEAIADGNASVLDQEASNQTRPADLELHAKVSDPKFTADENQDIKTKQKKSTKKKKSNRKSNTNQRQNLKLIEDEDEWILNPDKSIMTPSQEGKNPIQEIKISIPDRLRSSHHEVKHQLFCKKLWSAFHPGEKLEADEIYPGIERAKDSLGNSEEDIIRTANDSRTSSQMIKINFAEKNGIAWSKALKGYTKSKRTLFMEEMKNLNVQVSLVELLSRYLKIEDHSSHIHLSDMDRNTYIQFRDVWNQDSNKLTNLIVLVTGPLAEDEFLRRVTTMLKQIYEHTVVENWKIIKERLIKRKDITEEEAKGYEDFYKLAERFPKIVNQLLDNASKPTPKLQVEMDLMESLGIFRSKRHVPISINQSKYVLNPGLRIEHIEEDLEFMRRETGLDVRRLISRLPLRLSRVTTEDYKLKLDKEELTPWGYSPESMWIAEKCPTSLCHPDDHKFS
ncbi:hypothetical protein MJO29_007855 [Puccinia striiformis f. sp. tritici]|nr:hypothetical protein MJO29_007855 [Puccinia striiformis f. sp. tritici]